jgi:hypothetical protein
MKTSDKILLYSTLSAVGLFAAIDLLQFAQYRSGDILDFKALQQRDYTRHSLAGIHWLVLDGPILSTLRPSENDSLEFDVNKMQEAGVDWVRRGDTLTISKKGGRIRSPHDNWYSFMDYTPVHLYTPSLRGIRVNNGNVSLANESGKPGLSAHFVIDSTQMWVGAFMPDADSVYSVEPWDTISVRGANSNFILNRQAHVKELGLLLDNGSQAEDRFSKVDPGFIQGDTNTIIHIRGKNFGKIRLRRADRSTP